MNELYGSSGRIDRPGESAELGGVGRDVTYAPAHAGLESQEMSRDEAYGLDDPGVPGDSGGSVAEGRDSGGFDGEGAAGVQGEGAAVGSDDGGSGANFGGQESAGPVVDGAGLAGTREETGATGAGGVDGADPGADPGAAREGTHGWSEAKEAAPAEPVVTRDDGREPFGEVRGRGMDAPAVSVREAQPDGHDRQVGRDKGDTREPEGGDGSGRESRSEADRSRREGTAAESEAKPEGSESAEPKQKPQIHEQDSGPDGLQQAEPDAAADQQPDVPGLSPMEQFKAELKADLKAEIKEELRSEIEAELREELKSELKTEIKAEADSRRGDTAEGQPDQRAEADGPREDRESIEPLRTPDVISTDEEADGTAVAEEAQLAAVDRRIKDEDDQEVKRSSEVPDRSGFSEETAQTGQDALGVAGSLGIVNPLVSLAVSADSARRKFQKMSPPDQVDVINLADTATKAFGSMSPGTAVVAVTLSTAIPAVRDKIMDTFHHIKRKD